MSVAPLLISCAIEYLPSDIVSLLGIGDRFENGERLAHGIRCPDLLWQLLLVVLDQTVRRIDDVLGRSVILFEFEDLCVRVVAFEVEYVLDVRPPERVNALGVIAHHTDVLKARSKSLHNDVLRVIGVLVLIHQDVAKAILVFGKHFRKAPEQLIGLEQQIVKIHGSCPETPVAISGIQRTHSVHFGGIVLVLQFGFLQVHLRSDQGILERGYPVLNRPDLVEVLIESQFFHQGGQQLLAVLCVVDGETLWITESSSFGS